MVNVNTQQAVYTKATPVQPGNSASIGQPPQPSQGNPKKPSKMNAKSIGVVIGLVAFLILAMAGAVLTLRLQRTDTTTAPTQTLAGSCTTTFTVPEPPEGDLVCDKVAFQDELSNTAGNYDLLTQRDTYEPGEIVVFNIEVTNNSALPTSVVLTDSISSNNEEYITFLDSNCSADAYDETTNTLTCEINSLAQNQPQQVTYRLQISESTPTDTTITNDVIIDDTQTDTEVECSTSITVTTEETPEYSCNSECTTDAQCQTANDDYTCAETADGNRCRLEDNEESVSCEEEDDEETEYSCNSSCDTDEQCQEANAGYVCLDTSNGKRCRLDDNRSSQSCTPPSDSYTCNSECDTNAQCQTANDDYVCYVGSDDQGRCRHEDYVGRSNCQAPSSTPPPTAPGCNETCQSNADCANSAHVCYQTADGRRCRLADYVNSASCNVPPIKQSTGTTSTPTTPTQPVEPDELPEAGADDIVKMLGAGAGALILGGLFILLLL